MPDRIEALVAQILNARELVLNKGEADGVLIGMRFAIVNRNGAKITDPETGEDLGSAEIEKTVVKIVRIAERFAVGRTFRTTRHPAGSLYSPITQLMRPPRTEVETLRTDERESKEELSEEDSYVKIGDPAIQIIGDEFLSDE
ncbi:MAG TPA: hypothetical protein VGL93_11015 [Streptosporangiaceae bacterium]|jgi:hypothetical protein